MSWTQKVRASIISRCLSSLNIKGKSVLDVGCGNGIVSQYIQKEYDLDLYATDIHDYLKRFNANIKFTLMKSKDELPFSDEFVDIVTFCDVLHHMKNIKAILLEGNRVASEAIFIFEDCESALLRFVDIGLNIIYDPNMPCPLNFKTYKEWCTLLKEIGFSFTTLMLEYPFWYPFKHMAFVLTKVK